MLAKHALETQMISWQCGNVQTGSGTHPASYSIGTRFFPGGKADGGGGDVEYSPPSSAEVKNDWRYTDTPLIRLHSVGMNNFTFLLLSFIWFPYPTGRCNSEAGYFLERKKAFLTPAANHVNCRVSHKFYSLGTTKQRALCPKNLLMSLH